MPEAATTPLDKARQLAGVAAAAAVIAGIIILISAVAGQVIAPAAVAARSTVITPDWQGLIAFVNVILLNGLAALPSLLLAAALFDLQKVMAEYEKGNFFTLKSSTGIRKVGEDVLWALAAKVAIVPFALYWITREGRMGLEFETFDLGLIAIGVLLMLMGRVLEAATAIKSENEQIV